MSGYPSRVTMVEVGARDGLQNEKQPISSAQKVELIGRLVDSGLKTIEAGSFVSPKWVPQVCACTNVRSCLLWRVTAVVLFVLTAAVCVDGRRRSSCTQCTQSTRRHRCVLSWCVDQALCAMPDCVCLSHSPLSCCPVLTPNMRGYEAALSAGATTIAIFGSASESFSQKNINCSIEESFDRFTQVAKQAARDNIRVRGYVSCVLGCPYEGEIEHSAVERVTARLLELGCYEVSLGDTIGVGTVGSTDALLRKLLKNVSPDLLAAHFHDTYGQALANLLIALQHGITSIDSSVGGLGGCPYAPAAKGNVATEDVVYMLNGMGIETGVDIDALVETAGW